jgi:hypothetical protein
MNECPQILNMASTPIGAYPIRRRMLPVCMMFLLFATPREPALGTFNLLLANHIVEVSALDLPPASHVRLRQNIYDVVVIALEDSTLTLAPPEGEGKDVQLNHGEVRVLREFNSALASCKEFSFSVGDGDDAKAPAEWFVATACQQSEGWKWASAEPAVERWGNLQ